MWAMVLGIIVGVLSAIIALLALSIGGYPKVLKVLSYFRFPPARFFSNAMQGIEKLEALGDATSGQIKQGTVNSSDVGYSELAEILRENRMISGTLDAVISEEVQIRAGASTIIGRRNIPLTPQRQRLLSLLQNGQQIILEQEQFDPSRITRNLKNWAEEITRNRVANWILIIIALYLIATIVLIIIT